MEGPRTAWVHLVLLQSTDQISLGHRFHPLEGVNQLWKVREKREDFFQESHCVEVSHRRHPDLCTDVKRSFHQWIRTTIPAEMRNWVTLLHGMRPNWGNEKANSCWESNSELVWAVGALTELWPLALTILQSTRASFRWGQRGSICPLLPESRPPPPKAF